MVQNICFHFAYIPSLTYVLFRVCCLIQIFEDFPAIIPLSISSLASLWFESRHCMISIILNVLMSILWPRMWSILVKIHVCFRRMCILPLLYEAVYWCPLYPADWWCWWIQSVLTDFFAFWTCPFQIEECWSLQP